MSRSLYLVNPKPEAPSYFGAEFYAHWGFPPTQSLADLSSTTVAAMAPDDWQIEICDEYIQAVDLDNGADYVGLTGKITQASRMLQLAAEFRRRGRTVIIGGPFASLSPERVRGHCDVLVIGELEAIAERFFADLESGEFQSEYLIADKPDLRGSPRPRWDLYPNDRAVAGCIQTSRGCPFECEFCDVIQYLGRKQRHKSVEQILDELESLYALDYRNIFLADDNFTVYRKRAKEVLAALGDWNRRHAHDPVAFGTQLSIDAARDPEIMRLLSESGMTWVFIGIETPNQESLKESKKRQNVGVDLGQQIEVFFAHGIHVTAGMIVGFDHDGPDIFQRQYDFAMSTPIPMFSLGALVAPAATPLYDRMEAGGRLLESASEVAANPWDTNIRPTQMTRKQLLDGLQWLSNRLYRPEQFGRRVVRMIEQLGPRPDWWRARTGTAAAPMREVNNEALAILRRLIRQGPGERAMYQMIYQALEAKPEARFQAMHALQLYAQVRCLYDAGQFWEPRLAEQPSFAGQPAGADPGGSLITIGR
jgi:radical SAM superfamily enzyme YgiQ (UPF0313 family)